MLALTAQCMQTSLICLVTFLVGLVTQHGISYEIFMKYFVRYAEIAGKNDFDTPAQATMSTMTSIPRKPCWGSDLKKL